MRSGLRPRAAHRDAAAEEPAVGAVLVADAVLVLEDLRRAGEVRVERRLRARRCRRDGRGRAIRRVRRSPRAPAGRSSRASGPRRRTPASAGSTATARRWRLPPRAPAARRCCLQLVLGARALGDVVPQQRHAAGDRQHLDLHDARVRRRPAAAGGSATRGLPIARRVSVDRRAAARCAPAPAATSASGRPSARSPEQCSMRSSASFHSVTRPSPSSTDMPCSRCVDHFAAPVRLLEPVHVVGVDAVGEEQRGGEHRRDVPHPPIDHLDERRRDAGAEQVDRASGQRAPRPRSIDGPPRDERHDDVRERALRRGDRRRRRRRSARPATATRRRPAAIANGD